MAKASVLSQEKSKTVVVKTKLNGSTGFSRITEKYTIRAQGAVQKIRQSGKMVIHFIRLEGPECIR